MKKTKIILMLITIFCLALSASVNATTGTFNVSKTSISLKEGKTTTFNIFTTNCEGQFTIISSDSSVVKVSSSSEWVTDSKTITLTALKAGTAKITVKANDVADTDEEEVTGSETISVTVEANKTTTDKNTTTDKDTSTTDKDTTTTKEKSSNAYLSTLGVTPKEYDFSGFSKTKTSYSVTVPSDVDSLKVLYKTADSNATVKVSGNSGFETGSDNKITIKVTAEDGKTTKTYTIKVTKLTEEEEKPGNVIEDEDGLYLKSLSIEGIDLSPEYVKDTYSYTATLKDSNISEVKVNAEANNENAKIDISGNTDLVEGENTINILLTLEDSTVQTVYQVIITKEETEVPVATTEDDDTSTTDLIGTIKNYAGIAIGVIVLIVVAVIILIVLLIKENKKIREENDEDEEIKDTKSEEYNVYKNDENEFANNDMQKDNFIESLYNQRNGNLNDEDLTEDEKETLEEISKQTEKIFEEKEEGQSVEYNSNAEILEDPLEIRKKRKGKGKHSI